MHGAADPLSDLVIRRVPALVAFNLDDTFAHQLQLAMRVSQNVC